MIGTVFLFLLPLFWALAWYAETRYRLCVNHYLDSVKERTLFDDVLQMRLERKLFDAIKKHGFYSWSLASKDGIPTIGFVKTKKKRMLSVELYKLELKYYVGDKKTEEQDIEDNEWTAVSYNEIQEDCNLEDLLQFLSGIKI